MHIQIWDEQNVCVHPFTLLVVVCPTCNALGGIYDLCHIPIGVISNVCCNHKYCTFTGTSTITYTYFKLVYMGGVLPVCMCVCVYAGLAGYDVFTHLCFCIGN
jgi:hypothetical protein